MSTQLAPPPVAPAGAPPAGTSEPRYRSPLADTLAAALIAAVATAMCTVAVGSMLSGTRWLFQALGAVCLIMLLGLALRAVRAPRPLVVLAQALACICYVTAFYAAREGVLGFVPGSDATGRLRDRIDAGITELNDAAIPFTPGPDAALVTILGVVGTAIAVDALSAGYRRPVLAGLPLLTLYAVPALTLPEGPRTWLFVLPALGLLLLFAGDDRERLRRWGLLPDSADLVRASARRTGAQISLIVLALSLVLPLVIPKVSAIWREQGIGKGKGPIETLDPLVEMHRNLIATEDVDLLQVISDTARPDEQYLRTVTLDEFTGAQWRAADRTLARFDAALPPVPGLAATVSSRDIESTIYGLPEFRTDYLPMPYPSTSVVIAGKWRVDPNTSNVLSTKGLKQVAGRNYTVTGLDLDPRRGDVGDTIPDGLARYLELPKLPEKIKDTAKAATKGAKNPLEIGLKLQSWFRGPLNFTYDLRAPQGSGGDAILAFIQNRVGYCEQFASTMAVMARMLGVPARVDVGFTAGEDHGLSHEISAHDAHAWPELFLPRVGWTRFEPTPGNADSGPVVPSWLQDDPSPKKDEPDPGDKKNRDAKAGPPPPIEIDLNGGAAPSAKSMNSIGSVDAAPPQGVKPPAEPQPHDSSSWLWISAFVPLFLLLLLAVPWALRQRLRRRRWASVAEAGSPAAAAALAEVAWLELRDTALDLGYPWSAARTPRQTAAVLVKDAWLDDRPSAALTEVTGLVEQTRYSAGGGSAPDPEAVRTAVETVCASLALVVDREARLRARVVPRSLRLSLFRPTLAKVSARLRRRPDESPRVT